MLSFNKGLLELTYVDSRARPIKIASSTRLESSSLDRVWIESTWRRSFGVLLGEYGRVEGGEGPSCWQPGGGRRGREKF